MDTRKELTLYAELQKLRNQIQSDRRKLSLEADLNKLRPPRLKR